MKHYRMIKKKVKGMNRKDKKAHISRRNLGFVGDRVLQIIFIGERKYRAFLSQIFQVK